MSHTPDCPIGKWQSDFDAWFKMEDGPARSTELARLLDELRRIYALVDAKAKSAAELEATK